MNDISKYLIGLFPDEQENMANLGLYFDQEIKEHFDYFSFDNNIETLINNEFRYMQEILSNEILIDCVEQFWFAHKAETTLEKSTINHLFSKLPSDFPIGELYVVYSDGYVSFQIVCMPSLTFPYLTALTLIQNETADNKDTVEDLIARFNLNDIYNTLIKMKK